jgi:hypothetical protein
MGRSRKRSAKGRRRLRSRKTPTPPVQIEPRAQQSQAPTPPRPEPSPRRFVTLIQKCWKVVTIGAVFLSLTNILLGWASSVSVASSPPWNPSDPFSAPFAITNDGKFRIYNVEFACYIARMEYQPPDDTIVAYHSDRLRGFSLGGMGAGETRTIQCPHPIRRRQANPIREVEVMIQVCFRPLLLPWRTGVERRFIAILGHNGYFQWVRQPIVEASVYPACYQPRRNSS